ncbi:hypothetical protein MKQ70_31980 [Chitinophaga sedimenti]|uniref:hypothetical protein n=1 Tax=Chitinophaga sedimenti TaxID=2033606 RepID=UPI00200397A4|nr:hypothetical protein [Chitinophaga sedimenti]MCK7559337.1 hypothetical protein [Chitinophaga sedimenti]
MKVYLAYVLLHELGHHELGHGSAGNLSYENKGDREFRQKEKDADRYAFTIFGKLLQANPMVRKKADSIIEITLDNATQKEDAAIAILYMAETILLCMQFGLSPYSQYYSDDAHPTYLDRINGVAEEIAALPDIRPDIVAKARRLQKTIAVTQSLIGRYDIAEITLNDGILDAAFYPEGVRFISTKFNGYTQIPFAKVRQYAGSGLWHYNEQPADLIPFKASLDSSADIILFSLKNAGTYCLEKGTDRLYAVEKNAFRMLPADTFDHAFETPGTVVYGPMPSPNVYVLAGGELKSVSAKGEPPKHKSSLKSQLLINSTCLQWSWTIFIRCPTVIFWVWALELSRIR